MPYFSSPGHDVTEAVAYITLQIRSSTDLTVKQKADCIEALGDIIDYQEPGFTTNTYTYTGANGYISTVFYSSDYNNNLAYVSLSIDNNFIPSTTTTTTPAPGSTTTTTTTTIAPWSPGTTPAPVAIGTRDKNFVTIKGTSVVLPEATAKIDGIDEAPLNFQVVGGVAVVTSTSSQYIQAQIVASDNSNLPNYTLATLYVNGVSAVQGYSVGDKTSINLYHTFAATGQYAISCMISTEGSVDWIPVTTLKAFGNVRFINGSTRGFIVGTNGVPGYGNYALQCAASGCIPGTYIRKTDFIDSNTLIPFTNGTKFSFVANNNSSFNPLYGTLTTGNTLTLDANSSGNPGGVYDSLVEFTVGSVLSAATIPFKIYTPFTFAVTGVPIWIQTVIPDSLGFNRFKIDWGDGAIPQSLEGTGTGVNYFTHAYTQARETPYSVSISANVNGNAATTKIATLSARFYIQNSFPTIDLEDYKNTLGLYLELPYSKSEVEIGSNEWVTANNINAAFGKLETNFNYLNNIGKSIKKSPSLDLVEWIADLVSFPTWNTELSGSNDYYALAPSILGITQGKIVDFKSYPSPYSAPDFTNFIAYDSGLIQTRLNNYNNTIVSQVTSLTLNSGNLNFYSLDAYDNSVYVLASNKPATSNTTKGASIYRFELDYKTNTCIVTNQVGGDLGTKDDNNYFGYPYPQEIKAYKELLYVGDFTNSCIKVYNSALSYNKTIFTNNLSAYNVLRFDINPVNDNIYVLGRTIAPNAPVITSVSLTGTDVKQYRVTWNHDGERLKIRPGNNFEVYGLVENGGGYTLVDGVSTNLTGFTSLPKLTTYVFPSSSTYASFKVKALGITNNGINYNSDLSSSTVVPNDVYFSSPYKLFVYSNEGKLINTLYIPEVPATADIRKILVDQTGTFLYVVTEEYVYKYTSTGIYVNRITDPGKTNTSLGVVEKIVTAFIDKNNYFYIVTDQRIFKYIDITQTSNLVNYDIVNQYYYPTSAYQIGPDEFISDWVYNKAIEPLLFNHEILAKNINNKYVVTVDGKNELISFGTRSLSAGEYIYSLSADNNNYIYSNEIVSSAVVNRAIDKIYTAQETILEVLKPEIVKQPPSYLTNVLGKITTSPSVMVYKYIEPDVTPTTTTTTEAPLPTLFSFASAVYIGNTYSPVYSDANTPPTGSTARYFNDYSASLYLINALSSTNLIVKVRDNVNATFAADVFVSVKQNSKLIYTAKIESTDTLPVQYSIPLNLDFAVDSSSLEADGRAGTYGAKFEVLVSVGNATGTPVVKPKVLITSDSGHLYNAAFTTGLLNGAFSTATLYVYGLSGETVPYAGVGNNTLGGYLSNIPTYAEHSWSNDGDVNLNPRADFIPTSTDSINIDVARGVQGETEVAIAFSRVPLDPPAVPFYTITTESGSIAGGGGYMLGAGSYPAGSLQRITAVGTYMLPQYVPGTGALVPLIIRGQGCFDAGTYTSTGGRVSLTVDPNANQTTSYWTVFVDGNMSNYTYFHH